MLKVTHWKNPTYYKLKAHCIPRHKPKAAASCTSSHPTAAHWGEGSSDTTSLLTPQGAGAPQQEDIAAIPDGSLHAPCLGGLFSLPLSFFKSWQILSLSPFDKLITFFSITFRKCWWMFLSFPVHTSVHSYQEISQVSLSSFSPPTHLVSNNTNKNAKKFKKNKDICQVSCSCLFNTSCSI